MSIRLRTIGTRAIENVCGAIDQLFKTLVQRQGFRTKRAVAAT